MVLTLATTADCYVAVLVSTKMEIRTQNLITDQNGTIFVYIEQFLLYWTVTVPALQHEIVKMGCDWSKCWYMGGLYILPSVYLLWLLGSALCRGQNFVAVTIMHPVSPLASVYTFDFITSSTTHAVSGRRCT